jgi:hypothetical protein|tara:strand:+ start:6747 stop:7340 length:594 start_codon:yes stop_codon:yes gene_type:complete
MNKKNDRMGQDVDPGEPDPAAVEAVRLAQTEALITSVEKPVVAPPPVVVEDDISPEAALKIIKAASRTREGRAIFKIQAGEGAPSGHYHRDFDSETHLHVTGGIEVRHPIDPETGFTERPLPPGYITRYIATDGTTTDYKDDTERPAGSGRPIAARDPEGGPLLTDGYKRWIDLLMENRRMGTDVRSDLEVHGQLPE